MRDGSIVLYGDALPAHFDEYCRCDFPEQQNGPAVDLLLVFGTSLQVAPFCAVPNMAPRGCTRVLVNRDLNACMTNSWSPTKQNGPYGSIDLSGRCFAPRPVLVGGRNITLRPLWRDRQGSRRWPQLLVESESDSFVQRFFASPEAQAHGLLLRPVSSSSP